MSGKTCETEVEQKRQRCGAGNHDANGGCIFFFPWTRGQSMKTSPYLLNKNSLAMSFFGWARLSWGACWCTGRRQSLLWGGRTQARDEHLIARGWLNDWVITESEKSKGKREPPPEKKKFSREDWLYNLLLHKSGSEEEVSFLPCFHPSLPSLTQHLLGIQHRKGNNVASLRGLIGECPPSTPTQWAPCFNEGAQQGDGKGKTWKMQIKLLGNEQRPKPKKEIWF